MRRGWLPALKNSSMKSMEFSPSRELMVRRSVTQGPKSEP